MMDDNISAKLRAEIDRARAAGTILAETEHRAVKAWYENIYQVEFQKILWIRCLLTSIEWVL